MENNEDIKIQKLEELINENIERNKKVSNIIKIGGGSFGKIYSAKYDNQYVAIKVLKNEKTNDTQYRINESRIIKEINTLLNIHHPNIIHSYFRITFTYENNDYYLIFMNKACNKDLSSLIYYIQKKNIYKITNITSNFKFLYFLSEKTINFIINQIFKGVFCLHQHNIIHNDLKPSNILINKNFVLNITDFSVIRGISKLNKTMLGFGTISYASIENYQREILSVDAYKVDYFSIGCILFELITRKKLIQSKVILNATNKIRAVTQEITKGIELLKHFNELNKMNYSIKLINLCINLIQPEVNKRINFKEIMNSTNFLNEMDVKYICNINETESNIKLFIELQKNSKNLSVSKKRTKYFV